MDGITLFCELGNFFGVGFCFEFIGEVDKFEEEVSFCAAEYHDMIDAHGVSGASHDGGGLAFDDDVGEFFPLFIGVGFFCVECVGVCKDVGGFVIVWESA